MKDTDENFCHSNLSVSVVHRARTLEERMQRFQAEEAVQVKILEGLLKQLRSQLGNKSRGRFLQGSQQEKDIIVLDNSFSLDVNVLQQARQDSFTKNEKLIDSHLLVVRDNIQRNRNDDSFPCTSSAKENVLDLKFTIDSLRGSLEEFELQLLSDVRKDILRVEREVVKEREHRDVLQSAWMATLTALKEEMSTAIQEESKLRSKRFDQILERLENECSNVERAMERSNTQQVLPLKSSSLLSPITPFLSPTEDLPRRYTPGGTHLLPNAVSKLLDDPYRSAHTGLSLSVPPSTLHYSTPCQTSHSGPPKEGKEDIVMTTGSNGNGDIVLFPMAAAPASMDVQRPKYERAFASSLEALFSESHAPSFSQLSKYTDDDKMIEPLTPATLRGGDSTSQPIVSSLSRGEEVTGRGPPTLPPASYTPHLQSYLPPSYTPHLQSYLPPSYTPHLQSYLPPSYTPHLQSGEGGYGSSSTSPLNHPFFQYLEAFTQRTAPWMKRSRSGDVSLPENGIVKSRLPVDEGKNASANQMENWVKFGGAQSKQESSNPYGVLHGSPKSVASSLPADILLRAHHRLRLTTLTGRDEG